MNNIIANPTSNEIIFLTSRKLKSFLSKVFSFQTGIIKLEGIALPMFIRKIIFNSYVIVTSISAYQQIHAFSIK